MLVNYRTYITLIADWLFNLLVKYEIINLTNPVVSKEALETVITTILLILAAVFRKYAGKPIPLLQKKPVAEGGKK